MLKKLFVVFCVIALALSVFSMTAAAQNSEPAFEAGYAMVDINPYWSVWTATGGAIPYAKYTDSNIMPLPMDGYGGSMSRLAEPTLTDDNGDDIVGAGDGLQATCIALQYGDQTLLLIAVDVLRIDDHWGNDARELISDATGIPVGNIMLSASHTHGGVDMDVSFKDIQDKNYTVTGTKDTYTGAQIGAYRDAYVEYVEEQILAAATTALDNAVKASAHRGTINANTQSKVSLNGVRHYKRTDANSGVEYVAGPNFNGSVRTGDTPVFEGNQQLHVLEFVPENGGEPIVLVNWRAHTNTGSKSQNHYLTSDYVGSMRKTLSNAGYRASFYLGAAGNHGNFNGVNENEAWYYASDYAQRSVNYGTTLAEVALALLENENVVDGAMVSNMAEVATGEIRAKQLRYRFGGNKATDVENKAATNHNNGVGCKRTSTGTYPCAHTVQDESGNEVTYVLASAYHVDNIIKRYGYGQNWVVNNSGNGVELNVLTIGRELAFVTAPMELFDLYSDNTILAEAGQDNDWDLLADFGYGTPFVFSCTNEHWGYVPNKLGYNYNKGVEHAGKYAVGSYEAQTSYFAEGTGEKLIELYTQMLTELSSVTKSCAACGAADVQWQPLTAALLDSTQNALAAGHYYLDSDLETDTYINISGTSVCLDLNGHSVIATGENRTFAVVGSKTLSVMDTSKEQNGKIVGSASCKESAGGNLYVTGTLNLYSGTITGGHAVQNGGNVFVYDGGTFNLYGGLVENGTVDAVANSAGGNVCGSGGTETKKISNICLAGGMIRGGAMGQYTSTIYSNVFAQGNLILTGSSEWEEPIQVGIRNGSNIIVRGTYTGKLNIWAASGVITKGAEFGSYEEGASIVGAQITLQGQPELKLALVDGAVKVVEAKETAKIGDTIYASLGDALAHGGTEEEPIVLLTGVDEQSTLVKTAYLDLNGHDIANVITNSHKLYVMDSATADFDVTDGSYGKILAADEATNVKAMTGYLKAANEMSFHKYEMEMTNLVVNTEERGITYKSSFKGDQFVQAQIKEFGIAMRAYNAPNQTSIWADPDCKTHVALNKGQWTNNAIKSVYVSNIIDPTLDAATNQARAQVGIFGRAYILLEDGTMIFGGAQSFSMQSAMEHVDYYFNTEYLDAADRQNLVNFYTDPAYKSFMETWKIPNIKAASK